MKTEYKYGRLNLLPETIEEEEFCKMLIRRITDSRLLMSWYGDVSFDGKETCGYIITTRSKPKLPEKENK